MENLTRDPPALSPQKVVPIGSQPMLQKLQRLADLKRRYKAVVDELDELHRELFGERWNP